MEPSEAKIPNYIFEDLLFRRRLQRTLNEAFEKTNTLLAEQVKLLEERKALMGEIHAAVQKRWEDEEQSTLIDPAKNTGVEARDE